MANIKKKQYVFLSQWTGQELKCACLFHSPCCIDNKGCEEIELSLLPYDDIETCMKARRYERRNGAIRQK